MQFDIITFICFTAESYRIITRRSNYLVSPIPLTDFDASGGFEPMIENIEISAPMST